MASRVSLYESVSQLSALEWDSLFEKSNSYLSLKHLTAIEQSHINDIQPFYLTSHSKTGLNGVGYVFIFDFALANLSKEIKPDVLKTLQVWHPDFMKMKVMECGFISAIGESFYFSEDHLEEELSVFVSRMEDIALQNDVDFILIRDVPYQKFGRYHSVLKENHFAPCLGFPTTKLQIRWTNFAEYLDSMKSKTRQNLNYRLKKLHDPDISVEVVYDFEDHVCTMERLWRQVHEKADQYEHEELTASYFKEINHQLKDESFIILIRYKKNIVAFVLCFSSQDELSALHLGIDYSYNSQYDLYFNINLLCVKQAIELGKLFIDFGITSYNYKLMIGCELYPLAYFIKHMKDDNMTAALTKMLSDSIEQPENTHRVFKNQDISGRVNFEDLKKEVAECVHPDRSDIFCKAYQYTRTDILKLSKSYLFFPVFESSQKPVLQNLGKTVVMLGSNSYLGLGSNPEVMEAAKIAIDIYGTGCTGSPIMNGTLDLHADLADHVAEFMNKDAALLFSTGYLTNLGVISTIAGRHDVIITDSLNHASIIDGCNFARGQVLRYKHDDFDHLEKLLQENANRPKLVVVDSVFSMEGTIIDLPKIVTLAKKYHARIMVDEAHGIGVLGKTGQGAVEHFGLNKEIDLIMGTFSKSFAAIGGFVAGDAKVISFLKHVARPHLFTASLPPSAVATIRKALDLIVHEPERRKKVLSNAEFMAKNLQALGYEAKFQGTAVVPVYCRDELLTLSFFKKLYDEGVYTNPVLSPGVPKGSELLRTSYMATHDEKDLLMALEVFKKLRTPHFPKRPEQA